MRRSLRVPWWTAPLLCASLALTLRLLGLRFGLPFSHHWDEGWIADNTTNILRTPNAEPTSYHYGAPLSLLSALLFRVLDALEPHRMFDPGNGVLMRVLGRLVTAFVSASGAFATYLAARHAALGESSGRTRGVWAALLYATAAELVSHGRYAVTDADCTALVAWSLASAALFLQSGKLRWATGTVLFAALAVAFKVTALPVMVIPAIALVLRPCVLPVLPLLPLRSPAVGQRLVVLASIPAAAAVFFFLNPHVLLHSEAALKDLVARAQQTITGGVPTFLLREPGVDHLSAVALGLGLRAFHAWPAASVVAAVLGLVGLADACRARSHLCIIAAVHAMIAVSLIAFTSHSYLFRNNLVAIPSLCIGFGFAIQRILAWLAKLPQLPQLSRLRSVARIRHAPAVLTAALTIVYIAVPLVRAVRTQQLVDDARIRALDWIARSPHRRVRPVVVATSDMFATLDGANEDKRAVLQRHGVDLFPALVENALQAELAGGDYVLIVSSFDTAGDYGEIWPFYDVPGYRFAARFDASPYEHNFEVTPTWGGRYSAIVLARAPK